MARAGTWGGRTAEQRRAERRERMVGAAIDLWREQGWTAVTMRAVCAGASLNDRYFYEEFADRDGLLVAAWEQVRDDMLSRLTVAFAENIDRTPQEIARIAAEVVVNRMTEDPDYARILLMHHGGSTALEQCRSSALQLTAGLVVAAAQPFLRPDADQMGLRMDAIVGVGGFVELISAWQAGAIDCDGQEIVDQTVRIATTFGARYLTAS
ncbi:TetR/AcrR family transcriptional regulator [Nocardia sp. NPDC046473]|uniref:TetR/AcrR family transcriptional regulator n=1 Tax=Nocardia sp. NPDC046473 TaxID=3155733 RepID=UPI0033C5F2F2